MAFHSCEEGIFALAVKSVLGQTKKDLNPLPQNKMCRVGHATDGTSNMTKMEGFVLDYWKTLL